jgi:hypothetical protein
MPCSRANDLFRQHLAATMVVEPDRANVTSLRAEGFLEQDNRLLKLEESANTISPEQVRT